MELLTKVYHWLGSGPGTASILAAVIALIGAVAGLVTSYFVAGRAVYINSITAERSKWIEKLRLNIADYSAAIAHLHLRVVAHSLKSKEDMIEPIQMKLEEINKVASNIQLQLNPWGPIDKNILALVNSIVIRPGVNPDLIGRADELLIQHSQWLLKLEWEKVKYEAHGAIHRWWHNNDEKSRIAAYEAWSLNEGSMIGTLTAFDRERELDEATLASRRSHPSSGHVSLEE